MSLPDKTCAMEDAIATIRDGASVILGGFGVPGTPFCLVEALVAHGARDLTIIKNDANETGMGVDWLLQAGLVKRASDWPYSSLHHRLHRRPKTTGPAPSSPNQEAGSRSTRTAATAASRNC